MSARALRMRALARYTARNTVTEVRGGSSSAVRVRVRVRVNESRMESKGWAAIDNDMADPMDSVPFPPGLFYLCL